MQLTPELVARIPRLTEDLGPSQDFVPMSAEDYEALADTLLADRPPAGPVWVFAYGSLLWKPAFEPEQEHYAVAPGWHRAFRLRLKRWRGTPDRPGLMLVLDRGGRCRGVVQSLKESNLRRDLIALLRREVSSKVTTNSPRWIAVDIDGVRRKAIAFCADRAGPAYAGRQPSAQVADVLATAVGHAGSCAEYLLHTVESLERKGIRDRRLWELQAMVAARIGDAIDAAEHYVARSLELNPYDADTIAQMGAAIHCPMQLLWQTPIQASGRVLR